VAKGEEAMGEGLNKPGISRYGMLYKSHVEIKVKCSKT
jgi:hypothetical protein